MTPRSAVLCATTGLPLSPRYPAAGAVAGSKGSGPSRGRYPDSTLEIPRPPGADARCAGPGQSVIGDRTAARHVTFTVQALRALGAKIESAGSGWRVTGGGFSPVSDEVSVGSSGTTLYFLIGLAALGDRPVTSSASAISAGGRSGRFCAR